MSPTYLQALIGVTTISLRRLEFDCPWCSQLNLSCIKDMDGDQMMSKRQDDDDFKDIADGSHK